MKYQITDEREIYLKSRGKIILTACPGSGKTTSIVYKMKSLAEECLKTHGNHAGILCLSFTNKAVEELYDKYPQIHSSLLSYPHKIMTIDSFCSQFILMPFWYLVKELNQRPQILEKSDIYWNTSKNNGSEKYLVPALKEYRNYIYRYSPNEISFINNQYMYKSKVKDDKEFIKYAKAVITYRLSKGILNILDMESFAFQILSENSFICEALTKRFPTIIIDEAQDMSEIQHKIFDCLEKGGVENMEYVGDLEQSIYDWRGAKPILLQNKLKIDEWTRCVFSENRRSTQTIIDFYSSIRDINTIQIRSFDVEDKNIDVVIFRYTVNNENNLINEFERQCVNNGLKDCHVLVRGKELLQRLTGGSVKSCWKSTIPQIIIKASLEYRQYKINDLFEKIRKIFAELLYDDYNERANFIQDIKKDINFNAMISSFLNEIPSFQLSIRDWQNKMQELLKSTLKLKKDVDFNLKSKMNGYVMKNVITNKVEDFYKISNENNENTILQFNTIHSAKGASYDAVLLFLGEGQGNDLSINVFNGPSNLFEPLSSLNEQQRLAYVACSRAKQFLALAIPNTVSENEIKSKIYMPYELINV